MLLWTCSVILFIQWKKRIISLQLLFFNCSFFADETRVELVTTVLQTAALPLELFVLFIKPPSGFATADGVFEDEERFELSTLCLTNTCSAVELFIRLSALWELNSYLHPTALPLSYQPVIFSVGPVRFELTSANWRIKAGNIYQLSYEPVCDDWQIRTVNLYGISVMLFTIELSHPCCGCRIRTSIWSVWDCWVNRYSKPHVAGTERFELSSLHP